MPPLVLAPGELLDQTRLHHGHRQVTEKQQVPKALKSRKFKWHIDDFAHPLQVTEAQRHDGALISGEQ